MQIKKTKYLNMPSFKLENEHVSLHVLPDLGGKIASLFYKPQNFEVLAQPTNRKYLLPQYADNFAEFDTSGADEMYPAIDASIYPWSEYSEQRVPDHGELWSLPWQMKINDLSLVGTICGKAFPYDFHRTITLNDNTVMLKYQVTNTGSLPLRAFWAFHGLVACDEFSVLDIPQIGTVENVHAHPLLGACGKVHTYPETYDTTDGTSYRFDRIKSRAAATTGKFYVADKTNGQAAISLNQSRLRYELQYSPLELPYLGIWINEGGFKGEYNVGIEPTDGYYDSLTIAKEKGRLKPLQPNESKSWQLSIILRPL